MKEKLKKYFKLFTDKDLDGLSEMFSDTVSLSDWDISVYGKDNVLQANKNIFESVDNISVNPYAYYGGNNAYAVELTIEVRANGEVKELQVVDVITFDEDGLIDTIKAYQK